MASMSARRRQRWLAERSARMLVASIDKDYDQVAELLCEIGARQGDRGVFSACYAMAEAVRQWAFPGLPLGDGSLTADRMVGIITGGEEHDPRPMWAARFVAAYCNGDGATCNALYAMQDDERGTLGGVAALVKMAGDIGRDAQQHGAGV